MRELYAPLLDRGVMLFRTDPRTAELSKLASNAFLATKISFANALARVTELADADVDGVTEIMGADPRIGPAFLGAGIGYGGYCLPKDVVTLERVADRLGYDFGMLRETTRINDEALQAVARKVEEAIWNLEGKTIALFGLAFKPGTDDVRGAPALALARRLLDEGATVAGTTRWRARPRGRASGAAGRPPTRTRPPTAPPASWCAPSGPSSSTSTPRGSRGSWPSPRSSTVATCSTRLPSRRPAFHVWPTGRAAEGA